MPAGIVVPFVYMSELSHSLGISSESWSRCFSCHADPFACLSVQNGSSHDQLSAFASNTLASLHEHSGLRCNLLQGLPFSYVESVSSAVPSQHTLECTNPASTWMSAVEVSTELLQIYEHESPKIGGISSEAQWISKDSKRSIGFFLNMTNSGGASGLFHLDLTHCCKAGLSELRCANQTGHSNEVMIISQQSGSLAYQVDFDEDIHSPGGCEFAVLEHDSELAHLYIPFPLPITAAPLPYAETHEPSDIISDVKFDEEMITYVSFDADFGGLTPPDFARNWAAIDIR